ncbi:carboxypeptidase-like regulatory domain-containing protein [Catellatospora tritici]|uniref:carboxypeptidase-like regulatory domain-containing protein n=1 Tax=Catellatospora tritici TaxID=2851566 RepID=UPI001C2DEC51|nr:carboxypeptidase-like regulatory domain-containing protein [Catellatospora tritici]MBV1853362.1 carboxypeptidase-like regulatory domain-containing protein [Catellatospora tritici]
MRRSNLRRLGFATLSVIMATAAVSTAAHAEPDTGTIAGHLTYQGVPVVNALVYAIGAGSNSAQTDATGAYSITDLPPGDYQVEFSASGHPTQLAYGATDWGQAALIPVTAGATTTVDDSLLPYGTISGRLADGDGNGVAVSVEARSDDGLNSWAWASDGNFTLGVFPGTYRVHFMVERGGDQWAYGSRTEAGSALIEVAAGQTVTVNDTLLPTGSVAGRITAADGTPAAGITVDVVATDGASGAWPVTTDENGEYRADLVFAGDWRLRLRRPSGLEQWYPNVWTEQDAGTFSVAAGAVTTIDQQLLGTGSIAGRYTDANGQGVADVSLSVFASSGDQLPIWGSTGSDGSYSLPEVPAGSFVLQFQEPSGNQQFYRGKTTFAEADRIAVTNGVTATADDVRLPTGSLTISVRDGLTGSPLTEFSGDVAGRSFSTTTGSAVVEDVRIGAYPGWVYVEGYTGGDFTATVTAGQNSTVEVVLYPYAKLRTKVLDRRTGRPVADVCVFPVRPKQVALGDGCERTDASGQIELRLSAGKYQLFALPIEHNGLGAQWVGPNGGTGLPQEAKTFTLVAGQTKTVAPIRLDRAGTITGKVTSTTGQPLEYGSVRVVDEGFNVGGGYGGEAIAEDGTYRIDWLGPYQWPLLFKAQDHAPQWSGRVGNRLDATTVKVQSGKTTRYGYRMAPGTEVTVQIPGVLYSGFIVMENAVTGDVAGGGWAWVSDAEGATFRVLGPQKVKVRWDDSTGWHWYGGADRDHATVLSVPNTASKVYVLD